MEKDKREAAAESAINANAADFADAVRMPERFAVLNKLVTRDLNGISRSPSFYLYDKDQITEFLQNPYANEKQLRNAVIYLYGASSHFRRLIQYFASLSDLSYIVSPFKIDTASAKPNSIRRNYHKVLNLLSSMDIKNQFKKILTVCLREDVFYGTMWVSTDSIIIQQLPSDYCAIEVIEDNVLNVSFDFSYFNANPSYLENYQEEFKVKYELYKNGRASRWQELDSPTSFAIKYNSDILSYAFPPFAGILREVYDLEDLNCFLQNRSAHWKRCA